MVDPVECVTPPPLTYTDTELQVSAQYRPGHITQAPHVTRTGRANIRWYFTDASCVRILGGRGQATHRSAHHGDAGRDTDSSH